MLNIEAEAHARDDQQGECGKQHPDQTKLTLIQLLNLPENDLTIKNWKWNCPLMRKRSLGRSPLRVYMDAAGRHPGIQSAEMSVLVFEKAVAVSKGAFSPSLFLSASYGTGYSSLSQRITDTMVTVTPAAAIGAFHLRGDTVAIPQTPIVNVSFARETQPLFNQLRMNQNTQVGLSLSVPILNGLQNHAALRRSKIQLLNSRLNVDLQRQNLRTLIQTAFNDARAGYVTFEPTKKTWKP